MGILVSILCVQILLRVKNIIGDLKRGRDFQRTLTSSIIFY